MGKVCSITNSTTTYVTLVGGGSVLEDRSEDATAEEFPNPPTNLSLNNMAATVTVTSEITIATRKITPYVTTKITTSWRRGGATGKGRNGRMWKIFRSASALG